MANKTALVVGADGRPRQIQAGDALVAPNLSGTNTGDVANTALTTGTLAQFAATTSLQLKGVISDETGTGALVFATSPTLVTPALGVPASGNLVNCTGYTVGALAGIPSDVATFILTPSSANLRAAVTDETGTGALVFANTPTLVTPALGTPTSGNLANCTGYPAGVPTGSITAFGASSVPTGWLECDGSAVSRTTYADLFAALSTTWGAGNGTTTFNVPDLRGRAIIGVGTGSGLTARSLAGSGGAEAHALSTAELATHNHLMWNGNGYGNTTGGASGTLGIRGGGSADGYVTGDAGSGTAHNNMQPWRAAKFIIKT